MNEVRGRVHLKGAKREPASIVPIARDVDSAIRRAFDVIRLVEGS
jgi:hypothetical protein